jgi:hypothetical protein
MKHKPLRPPEFDPPSAPVITPEEAQDALQAAREARVRACKAELDPALTAILAKHRCAIDISIEVRAGANIPKMTIVAKD